MKKLYLLTVLFSLMFLAYAKTTIPEFEALGPQEKVDTLIKEYAEKRTIQLPLDFSRKATRIAEEKEETFPYMIYLLKTHEAVPYYQGPNEIEILDHIIDFRLFQANELSSSDLKELATVYTEIIDKYLQHYKKIDVMAVVLEWNLTKFSTGKWPKVNLRWVRKIYRKYVKLGYEGLSIDYEELKRVSGID